MKTLLAPLAAAMLLFISCQKETCADDQLSCQNGTMQQGACSCQPGYEGTHCDQEKLPVSVQLTHIAIQGYPTGACTNYDADDEPLYRDADLYMALYHNQVLLAHNRPLAVENYDAAPLIVNLENWQLLLPHDGYELRLYDRDEGLQEEDQLITSFHFFPYSRGKGFPDTYSLEGHYYCEAGHYSYNLPYSLQLHLQYSFSD
ncbi:calcium-binding EGF-like domain-containing protein [Cesiribacter andamanensis]|uniref:EGF-like domain-containing protein n=1 Tax=Cesiribacter andamanensis AMV16 TaxID=1279009 RepID=M7N6S5_9BACT|nr:hypothetical protein [Cesiribacter andamanensis]EMR04293.1 hypothetical protein ADICEAN_00579 [Cesiribacter andamanensis AMV16]